MAEYKVVDIEKLDTDLTTVADAIRAKTGGEEPLSFPEGMAGEVDAVLRLERKANGMLFGISSKIMGKKEVTHIVFIIGKKEH